MTPSDIATLQRALTVAADLSSGSDTSVIWWHPHVDPARVTHLSITADHSRAELDDGMYVNLLAPECQLHQFALMTRLADPAPAAPKRPVEFENTELGDEG